MIKALFGQSTVPSTLREALDSSMKEHREIGRRVAAAGAAVGSSPDGAPGASETSIADDMAAMADTQLRYEAEARLLSLVYQGLRRSIRSNG